MDEFVEQSNIGKLEFQPYTFGILPVTQTIIYIIYELFSQTI